MHNTVFLVGRLASDPNYHEVGDGKKVSNMCLAVTRSYKNEKGEKRWNGTKKGLRS